MKSETIGKLAEALAKAQGEMEFAKKDSLNPHFKNKYADIASVIEAIRDCLAKYNLSYVQFEEDDCLVTMLMHSSGEFISGKMKLLLNKQDMQAKGSAMTYARRYGLSAMVGIAQDDDDGNQAIGKSPIEKKMKDCEYRLPRGSKFEGKTFIEIDTRELKNYIEGCEKKMGENPKMKPGWWDEFIVKAEKHLGDQENKVMEEAGDFNTFVGG